MLRTTREGLLLSFRMKSRWKRLFSLQTVKFSSDQQGKSSILKQSLNKVRTTKTEKDGISRRSFNFSKKQDQQGKLEVPEVRAKHFD